MKVIVNPYHRSVIIDGEEVVQKILAFPDVLNNLATISCTYDEKTSTIVDIENMHQYTSHFIEREAYFKHLPEFVSWFYAEKQAQLEEQNRLQKYKEDVENSINKTVQAGIKAQENITSIADTASQKINTTILTGIDNLNNTVLSTTNQLNNLQSSIIEYVTSVENETIKNINTLNNVTVDNITNLRLETIEGITTISSNALNTLNTTSTNLTTKFNTLANNALNELEAKRKESIVEVNKALDLVERVQSISKLGIGEQNQELLFKAPDGIKAGDIIDLHPLQYYVGRNTIRLNWKGLELFKDFSYKEVGEDETYSSKIKLLIDIPANELLRAWCVSSNLSIRVDEAKKWANVANNNARDAEESAQRSEQSANDSEQAAKTAFDYRNNVLLATYLQNKGRLNVLRNYESFTEAPNGWYIIDSTDKDLPVLGAQPLVSFESEQDAPDYADYFYILAGSMLPSNIEDIIPEPPADDGNDEDNKNPDDNPTTPDDNDNTGGSDDKNEGENTDTPTEPDIDYPSKIPFKLCGQRLRLSYV